MRKFIAASFLVVFLTSGCSDANSLENSVQEQAPEPTSSAEPNTAWKCESTQDGLGESLACTSSAEDDTGTAWVLTLMCTSELNTLHSIVGVKADFDFVYWSVGAANNSAQVRIDAAPIDDWKFATKGGKGITFMEGKGGTENDWTWEFLSRIASAKTFGFKAFDAEGYAQSVKFNVENSVPVAAIFSALGCHGS